MITYREALQIIAESERLPVRELPLSDAGGCVSAETLASRLDVPDFDNAAMDGYALRASDSAGASESSPVSLRRVASVAAGDAPGVEAGPGDAIEIMTGAPVPAGCDAVLPVEQASVSENDGQIRFTRPAQSGQNLRRRGEDFTAGTRLLEAGTLVGAPQLMALAAGGLDRIPVRGPVRVAVVATGAELAEQGAPSGNGLIRDANGPYLRNAVPAFGAQIAGFSLAGDRVDAVGGAIDRAATGVDLVVTTGGVSAGRYDVVPAALAGLGADILFHKVSIRPGKPLLFARLPAGQYLLGLPGNPVAVAAGLRFFGAPLLRRAHRTGGRIMAGSSHSRHGAQAPRTAIFCQGARVARRRGTTAGRRAARAGIVPHSAADPRELLGRNRGRTRTAPGRRARGHRAAVSRALAGSRRLGQRVDADRLLENKVCDRVGIVARYHRNR